MDTAIVVMLGTALALQVVAMRFEHEARKAREAKEELRHA